GQKEQESVWKRKRVPPHGSYRQATQMRPTRGPSGGPTAGPGLRPTVSARRVQRVQDGLADPLWTLDAAPTTPSQRSHAQATLDAPPAAALCAGHQDGAPAAFAPRPPPCRCGTLEAVQQVRTTRGWQLHTAFIERVNLSMRQHGAAVGRRVSTLW